MIVLAGLGVWIGSAALLYNSGRGELEIHPGQGFNSVIVLHNDEGVIDENKLHALVTDWLSMKEQHTLSLPPGKYQLNVGTYPAGTVVGQWEVTTSGLFGADQMAVPVVNSAAIITVERGRRVTLRPIMRPAPTQENIKGKPATEFSKEIDATATDPDRRAAEYALSLGGYVKVNEQEQNVPAITDLQREPFRMTYVDLRYPQLPDSGLASFKGCKNLVYLSLAPRDSEGGQGIVTNEGLAYFKDCKNLTSLTLDSNAFTDAGLAYFKDCKNLTSLYLSCSGVTGAGLVNFKDCKNLIDLNLYGTQVSNAGLDAFADCKNLKNLDLGYTRVTDAGVVHFKDCKNLIDVSLYHTPVGDAGIAAFMDCKNLKNLNLNETQVGGVGLAQLKDCKGLRVLQLGDSKLTDAGLASLKNFEGLTKLVLWGAPVSDAGLALLAGFDNLTDLDLRYTKVTGRGLKGLAKVLPKCTITWDGGVIEPNNGADRRAAEYVLSVGGVVEINRDSEITAVVKLPVAGFGFRLTRVGLGNNPDVTDGGLAAFKDCQNLNILDLTGTPVTDAGLAHLVGLNALTNLLLTKTKVTAKGVEGLAKALPKCKITWDGGVIEPK